MLVAAFAALIGPLTPFPSLSSAEIASSVECTQTRSAVPWWTPERSEGVQWLAVGVLRSACALWCAEVEPQERTVLSARAALAFSLGAQQLVDADSRAHVWVQCRHTSTREHTARRGAHG
ncbi:MAG: hypothetical protein KTR31_26520 [Myxococcales bacterium]|nr:hypothetical protein [Myxococcales bacterium]